MQQAKKSLPQDEILQKDLQFRQGQLSKPDGTEAQGRQQVAIPSGLHDVMLKSICVYWVTSWCWGDSTERGPKVVS